MSDTRKASLEDLRKMQARGEISAPRKDASEIDMPEGFWDSAEIQEPASKTPISLRVDAEVLAFFKAQGRGYQTRMNAVLKSYVEAQKAREASS
jgi:uncharacterized protein (DUF4415 family)